MTRRATRVASLLLILLVGVHARSTRLHAQTSGELAAGVQPFVDRQELAGAVMLVADKEKVLATAALTRRTPPQTPGRA